MQSNTAPLSFSDLALRKAKVTRIETFLERVDENIDLSFTKQWHAELHPSERGRRPFDVDVLFRITLLQQFFGLSDPQAEQDIHDRSSYQMFLGITADTDIPDETTICRFRKMLVMKGWDNAFFKELLLDETNNRLTIRSRLGGEAVIDISDSASPKVVSNRP